MPRKPKNLGPPIREPDYTQPATLRAQAQVELAQRKQRERYATDPWAFLTECVFTLDQITGKTRPFPVKQHLETLTRVWERRSLLLVPKSRRMMVTWWGVAVNYWLARYRPGAKIAFLARKEGKDESEGSAELVWRAKFIHDHLPPLLEPMTVDYHFGRLAFPDHHSEILGVAEGADQLRQWTCTSVFGDEAAFWSWAYETYVGSRPTIEGGGRFTLVSTAGPGFFESLVYDRDLSRAA